MVRFTNIVVDPTLTGGRGGDRGLTYTAESSDPDLLLATIPTTAADPRDRKVLVLDPNPARSGTVTITITAEDSTGFTAQMSFTVTVTAAPLMLAGAADVPLPTGEEIAAFNPRPLSPEMQELVHSAVARWAAAGLDSSLVSRLSQANVQLADLPGGMLGLALADSIWLDADAAGRGWFLDPTPADDLEFSSASGRLYAGGGVDLLSVAAHELGHLLGLADMDSPDGIMSHSLEAGLRRLPTAAEVDALFARQ
jgi:hypothetical protein